MAGVRQRRRIVAARSVPDTFLVDHDLVATFEVGWAVLYQDVSMFVADQLMATLTGVRCADADIEQGLRTLRRVLMREREAGTPWRAREALDVLGMLDMAAWASVAGLLDECPVLPHALTAILDRHTGAVSATSFEFISTAAQLGTIRVFMRTLPHSSAAEQCWNRRRGSGAKSIHTRAVPAEFRRANTTASPPGAATGSAG